MLQCVMMISSNPFSHIKENLCHCSFCSFNKVSATFKVEILAFWQYCCDSFLFDYYKDGHGNII